ncbi:MAG: N-formylglutamate amidohydrolase [Candidatus Accumulibacter sp.]|uniref:N-formylglutamate amidohydrolase n=1 Tax=Candidatus Accumulibacter TaxID=327159 RepID=UPI002588B1B7|nr:N-formylglutamate amidohydrolase [Accumulibacter sp.]MBK8115955.1 N-formylglutamate amidohydrolase [Accumulibacter sp.]
MNKTCCLVVSCEHGGHEVPAAYAACFAGHEGLLESHRGWDAGAFQLGRQIAKAFAAPFYASMTTRLLVDLNRSMGHRHLFSEATRGLARLQRQEIVARHYRPHRDAVECEIARHIADGEQVIHIASHSFTPQLNGVVRRADVAWLYDPRRVRESALAQRWQAELAQRAPALRLRRNYPYQGRSDGLASLLRKRHPEHAYIGVELEVNQRFVQRGGTAWTMLRRHLVDSLAAALCIEPEHCSG